MIHLRALAAGLIFTAAAALAQNAPPARRALIIANPAYKSIASLPAVASGAALIEPVLRQMRFDVRVVQNTDLSQLDAAISAFAKETHPGDVVMLLYLGIAVQFQQENYILPAPYNPATSRGVDYEAYSMRRAASLIEDRQPAFFGFIVDAAWDIPILRKHFPEPGLARLDPNPDRPGALFAMSASPGKLAGDGSRSLYAQALANALQQQGLTLSQVVETIKRSVSEASGGRQIPSEVSTVVRDFPVNPKPADLTAWEALQNTRDTASLRRFAQANPNSRYAAQALSRADDLDWQAAENNDLPALQAYLNNNPNGVHRSKAETQITRALALEAFQKYRNAMQSRDLEQLKSVWPSLTKQQLGSFQNFFRDARSIVIDPAPVSLNDITATSVTVKAKRSLSYPARGNYSDIAVLKLKRSGDSMIIDSQTIEGSSK